MKFSSVVLTTMLLLAAGCDRKGGEGESDEIVLQHRLRAKVLTLDSANIGDTTSHGVGSEIFECLYTYHYLKRPYEIVPKLAAGMPQVSEDGFTYTIRIKEGVYFADDECFAGGKGRELKASDFVFAWKRLADVKALSKNWWVFDGKIVGLDEFREYTQGCKKGEVDYSRVVEGLTASDDYTLVVKLKRAWPQILHALTYVATAPTAKEAVDYYGKNIINHPVGTGAFRLKVWHRGSYIEMVRNENFRQDLYSSEGSEGDAEAGLLQDAGKAMPFVDRIVWRVVTEDQPRWLMFEQGDIDITSIPKDNYGQAIAMGRELTASMKERDIRLDAFKEPDTFYIGFNMEDLYSGQISRCDWL